MKKDGVFLYGWGGGEEKLHEGRKGDNNKILIINHGHKAERMNIRKPLKE